MTKSKNGMVTKGITQLATDTLPFILTESAFSLPPLVTYICGLLAARKILCPRPCSLCSYVCNGLPRQVHPPKVKYSLSAVYKQAVRQNISLCEGVLVWEDHYIHTSRENKALDTEYFWPIQTYRERRSSYH